MPEVYQIWNYDSYLDEVKEIDRNVKSWFKRIDEIGKQNEYSNEDIAEIEFCLAMLDEYDLIKMKEVRIWVLHFMNYKKHTKMY